MTRLSIAILSIALLLPGCTLHNVQPPAGCENSTLYKTAPWSFIALTSSRLAASQLMTASEYRQTRLLAAALADALSNGADWPQLRQLPGWANLLATEVLPLLLDRDQLDPCDRALLIAELQKW